MCQVFIALLPGQKKLSVASTSDPQIRWIGHTQHQTLGPVRNHLHQCAPQHSAPQLPYRGCKVAVGCKSCNLTWKNCFRFFSLKNIASKFDGFYSTETCVCWNPLYLNIVS